MPLRSRRPAASIAALLICSFLGGCSFLSIEEVPLPLAEPSATSSPPPATTTVTPPATDPLWPHTMLPPATIDTREFMPSPTQQALVGTECSLHPGVLLRSDTVRIHYGIVGSPLAAERPGVYVNSRFEVSGGCVVGPEWTEVAYCPECRLARRALAMQYVH